MFSKKQNCTEYNIIVLSNARKSLYKLPSHEKLKIINKLDLLITNQDTLNIKKLKNFNNLYRIKSGDYRIVYKNDTNQKKFFIIIICHRQNVYKILKKILIK